METPYRDVSDEEFDTYVDNIILPIFPDMTIFDSKWKITKRKDKSGGTRRRWKTFHNKERDYKNHYDLLPKIQSTISSFCDIVEI